jgi:RNA polymerase sigma-70 factor (ECF subfamily)
MALGSPESNGETDALALVERARRGDRDAFGALVTRYEAMVFATVCGVMRGNEANAPDMTQEVFMHAYLKIGQLGEPRAFGSWLRTIARRMAINGFRKKRFSGDRFQQSDDDSQESISDPLGLTPQEILIHREEQSSVDAAVSSMNDTHRRVVELFYREGLSLREIVGRLTAEEGRAVPEGTVKRRLHTVRKRVKEACSFLMDDLD